MTRGASRGSVWTFVRRNPLGIGAIALVLVTLFLVSTAPNVPNYRGSTYSRAPEGYGAWYDYMAKQGRPIQRWQKAPKALKKEIAVPATLLQVNPSPTSSNIDSKQAEWVAQGNRLVILGIRTPSTAAPFRTRQSSEHGLIDIETRRRRSRPLEKGFKQRLGDEFGAIVWEESIGKGTVIWVNTPYLGANAYQKSPGNYAFLARLVTGEDVADSVADSMGESTTENLENSPKDSGSKNSSDTQQRSAESTPLWVNEYIHGYRDPEKTGENNGQDDSPDLTDFFFTPPLVALGIQSLLLLLVTIWAANQRWGLPTPLMTPPVDNSKAFIQALAGVLYKADSSYWLVTVIGRAEQQHIQQALGLGATQQLSPDILTQAWVRGTRRPARELQQALNPYWHRKRLRPAELLSWLNYLGTVRQALNLTNQPLPDNQPVPDSPIPTDEPIPLSDGP